MSNEKDKDLAMSIVLGVSCSCGVASEGSICDRHQQIIDALTTARREEREAAFERACLAICARCRLTEQFTVAERVGDGRRWFHRAANTSFEDGVASQCDAWPIRDLVRVQKEASNQHHE